MTAELLSLFKRWENFTNLERDRMGHKREYRLDRMEQLCALFGHPEENYRIIHLAGSKGKGSTGVICASILAEDGFKTALYTSPHLIDYTERFRIFPKEQENESLLLQLGLKIDRKLSELAPGTLAGGDIPTTFEVLTLLAFLYFSEMGCQWLILETGLGGRLDATNVVSPEGVILTPIEREHQEFLGDTIEAIAGEKAGIIKPGVPVFTSFQKENVMAVFEAFCLKQKTSLYRLEDYLEKTIPDLQAINHRLLWKKGDFPLSISLSMAGPIQGQNAALAILCLKTLLPELSLKSIRTGAASAFLPGRGQIISQNPFILLDGAHTASSLKNMKEALLQMGEGPFYLLFGCASDKDVESMADILSGDFKRIIVTTPGTFKASDPQGVWECFQSKGLPADLMADTEASLAEIIKEVNQGGSLLIAGSFYLAGIAARWLQDMS